MSGTQNFPGLTSIEENNYHTISYINSMEKMHIIQYLYKIEKVF